MTMLSTILALFALLPVGDEQLMKYRLPEVTVSSFEIGLGHDGQTGTPSYYDRFLDFSLSPKYNLLILGERLNLNVGADVGLEALPVHAHRSDTDRTAYRSARYLVGPNVAGSADWYPIAFPIGLGGDLFASTDFEWHHQVPTADSSFLGEFVQRRNSTRVFADLGPTLGRMRDARTVIQALRVVELLSQENLVRRGFEDDDIQLLAVVLASKPAFELKFLQSSKDWLRGLGNVLTKRGLVPSRVPARTWFLIREALEDANSVARPVGYRFSVRPGLRSAWYSEFDSTFNGAINSANHYYRPSVVARLESGYPITRRWQVGENASWTIASDSLYTRHDLKGSVTLTYYVFDRLLASFDWSGLYTNHEYWGGWDGREEWDIWHHGLTLSASYYQEDMLKVSASAGYGASSCRTGSARGPQSTYDGLTWSLGASYRLIP
jgi:hypothetical protein